MICALTVRELKPGSFEDFREAFHLDEDFESNPPAGWVRFNMIRNTEDPNEVITFGFFDGTVEELRKSAANEGYAEQMEAIKPFVASVGADGLFEVVENFSATPA